MIPAWLRLAAGLALGAAAAGLPLSGICAGGEEAALRGLIDACRRQPGDPQLAARVGAFAVQYPKNENLAQLEFLAGEAQFASGAYAQALKTYGALVDRSPGSPYAESAQYRTGECYFNLGQIEQARKHWRGMLGRVGAPLRPEVLAGLAQCQVRLGAWEPARQAYADLLKEYPHLRDRADIKTALGLIAFNVQDYAGALAALEGVEGPEALYYTGRALVQLNKQVQAAEVFDRLVKRYPAAKLYVKTSLFEKAEIVYDLQHNPWARSAYDLFLLNYANDALAPYAQYKLGCIALREAKPGEALKRFEALARLNLPGTAGLLVTYLRAEALVKLGRNAEAYALYDGIWKQDRNSPVSADALLKKGWLHLLLGVPRKAQDEFELYTRTFTTSPILPHVYFLEGNALFQQGEYQQAIKVYHDTILNFPYSRITDACLLQIQKSYQKLDAPDKLIAATSYILQVLEVNFPPENETLRALCYFQLGEAYYQVRQYGSAVKNYLFIIKHFRSTPIDDLARESLAWSYFQDARYAESEQGVTELMRKPGLDPEVLKRVRLLRAHDQFNLKKFAAAESNYELWIRTYPKDEQMPEALFGLSQGYLRTGKSQKALEIMMRIVKQYQKSPLARKALLMIGQAFFNDGSYDKALQAYRLFLENWPGDPQTPEIRLRIAQTLYNAGRIDQARDAYRRYLAQYPDGAFANDARTGVELADWQETDNLRTEAKYRDFLKAHPKSEFADLAQYRLGILFYERKAFEDAVRELRALNYNYPGSQYLPNAQYYLGMAFEKLGQIPEAVKIYEQFVQNFSNHDLMPEVLSRLGEVRFRAGEFLEAAKAYRQILERYPLPEYEANALFNLGVCYEQNKAWTDAIATFMKFTAKYPTGERGAQVVLHIGVTYHQMQKYAQAAEYLEKALARAAESDQAEILYRLGNADENLGRTELAAGFYRRAQATRPVTGEFRLMALSQLGGLYEKQHQTEKAIAVYRDIAENSKNAQWRQIALKRARELERR